MKNKQQPRLQISTALKQDDYDALIKAKDKHGVGIADIIREGINAVNNKNLPSERAIIEVVQAGLKSLNEPIPHIDLTDTT